MLNALILGARELASLPIPKSNLNMHKIAFPSKKLPAAMHQRYIQNESAGGALIPLIMGSINREVTEREAQAGESIPEVLHERRLQIKKPDRVEQMQKSSYSIFEANQPRLWSFKEVAAESFIMPLINRFWRFMQDEQAREERTSHLEGRGQYRSGGIGLILNPLVLSHFLGTLAILVHASQNATEWLHIIAPESLELAISLGTKPISLSELAKSDEDEEEGGWRKEASVLTSSLELALVVLEGSQELDGGRTLGLEHTSLVLGAREWASTVFAHLEKGTRVTGGGGVQEKSLRRATAGVLLKVDAITSRWGRSMLQLDNY
jgi:telomere length regulation protein